MRRDGNLAAGGEGDLASLPVLEEKLVDSKELVHLVRLVKRARLGPKLDDLTNAGPKLDHTSPAHSPTAPTSEPKYQRDDRCKKFNKQDPLLA
jgi:hypothetical protein